MSFDPLAKVFSAGNSDSRLANLRPFPKGISGNPSGRPKKGEYAKLCEKIVKSREGKKLVKKAIIAALENGGMAAIFMVRELGERESGKILQEIEFSGSIASLSDEQLAEKYKKLTGQGVIPITAVK